MTWVMLKKQNGNSMLVNLAQVRTVEIVTMGIALRYPDGTQEVMAADQMPAITAATGIKRVAKRKPTK